MSASSIDMNNNESRMPALAAGVTSNRINDELVVYVSHTHCVHCLNRAATFIYLRCDGKTPVANVICSLNEEFETDAGEAILSAGLTALHESRLIESHEPQEVSGTPRREFLKRWGLAAAAIPIVSSIVAPTPAVAASACISQAVCDAGSFSCGTSCARFGNFNNCATSLCFERYPTAGGGFNAKRCRQIGEVGGGSQLDCDAARCAAICRASVSANYFCCGGPGQFGTCAECVTEYGSDPAHPCFGFACP